MCLVLLYLGDRATGDEQQVILAENRDEFFSRPTSGSMYYFDPDTSFRKSFKTTSHSSLLKKSLDVENGERSARPFVMLGPRDDKNGDDEKPLMGSPFLVGSGKRWAVITNALGPWDENNNVIAWIEQEIFHGHMDIFLVLAACTSAVLAACRCYGLFCVLLSALILPAIGVLALDKYRCRERGKHGNNKSRGQLLASFVNSDLTPEEFVDNLESRCRSSLQFDGFSILLGEGNDAFFVSNRPAVRSTPSARRGFSKLRLEKGRMYGLSNAYLDDDRGRVKHAKLLFRPVVEKLGCHFGKQPSRAMPISHEMRNNAVKDLFHEVMENIDELEFVTTTCIPEVDAHLTKVYIEPFARKNPDTSEPDMFGTRDTIAMIIGFDDVAEDKDDLVGLKNVAMWEIDRSRKDGPNEIAFFDERSHRGAARQYRRYWSSRGASSGISNSSWSSHSAKAA